MPRYRFSGDGPLVFPSLSGVLRFEDDDEHDPGELRPGDEFDLADDLAHPNVERQEGSGWVATVDPPEVQAAGGLPDKASDLVALLGETPGLADAVEVAENARSEPRKSVLDAIERARKE